MEQVLLEHVCWSQHGFTEGELCLANLIDLTGSVNDRVEDANFRRISTSFFKVFVSKQGFYSLNGWAARWVNRWLDGWPTGQLLTGHHPMQPEANKRCITGTCVRHLYHWLWGGDSAVLSDSHMTPKGWYPCHAWGQGCYLDRPRKARGMDSELWNSADTVSVMYPGTTDAGNWGTEKQRGAKNILGCINKTTSSRWLEEMPFTQYLL